MRCNPGRLIHFSLLLWVSVVSAQSGGIEFESDSFSYDDGSGVAIYRGDVKVIRSDMLLRGDEVEVFSEDGRILRIVSRANPSVFLDRSEDGGFTAEARQIEYDVEKKTVFLSGDAKVIDGKQTLEGDHIVYDLEKKRINATKGQGRVRLRIQD